ncbi:Transcription factor 25 [Anabarilius grahami]|uniref:Transcription factor 25 n=1 Tax=Anabarilius grahami TaxID=495550 RepID=A0A3N0XPN0_ANAGA|nr:Transcription factor 25 [Anabarilius grahami]
MPLLDLCTVQPDVAVSSHAFFGPSIQTGQPPALSELVSLYVGRCHSLWKEAGQMLWLEENVRKVLKRVDKHDPYVEDCQNKRKQRYQSAPRNIHRHVLMSEIKAATATLPLYKLDSTAIRGCELCKQVTRCVYPINDTDTANMQIRALTRGLGSCQRSIEMNEIMSLFRCVLLPV